MKTMETSIGIDLGGSSVKAVFVKRDGTLIEKKTVAFDDRVKGAWRQSVHELFHALKAIHPSEPSAVGVSAPGLADQEGRSIRYMPGRLKGLEGLDWSTFLEIDAKVPVLNDAHAALLGEVWVGSGRGVRHAIMLTLGTGVGGAAMVDGHLLKGHLGRAGHLGHVSLDVDGAPDICGTPGSLELWMGNCTIRERTNGVFATTHDLVTAHLKGDIHATRIWLRSVKGLAAAIASFVNILDPERVILGGGIARAGEALFVPLEQYLNAMEWRPGGSQVQVVHAELEEWAGAYGAASNALQRVG